MNDFPIGRTPVDDRQETVQPGRRYYSSSRSGFLAWNGWMRDDQRLMIGLVREFRPQLLVTFGRTLDPVKSMSPVLTVLSQLSRSCLT
jgi:hypothetical protein